MAIGQRIKFFRNRKRMTKKNLGEILGFLGNTSDVRMAQYESEARVPKIDLVKEMAQLFDISSHALTVPKYRFLHWSYAHSFCLGRYVWFENRRD